MFIYSYPFKWSEMYSYLDWELNVDSEIMTLFERTVRKDLSQQQESYSTYPVEMVFKCTVRTAISITVTPEPNSSRPPQSAALNNFLGRI